MNKKDMEQMIFKSLTSKQSSDTYYSFISCKVVEKTKQQLEYVLSPINENIFLEACAGSGKTEVVGMKTAYEISRWSGKNNGLAVLTFTNEATDTITQRVEQFTGASSLYPHYIGTLTGFIHGMISQKFGYKFFNHKLKDIDTTYKLIDKDIEIFNNHWLSNYVLPIPRVISNNKQMKIFANQVYFNPQIKDFIIRLSENSQISLTNYYNSDKFQEFVINLRKEKGKDWLFQLDYYKDEIKKSKSKFLKDGFANFEDMNYMAYWVLMKSPEISKLIASKYPVIFIDECQDLSWIEINILDSIAKCGSYLHFIGDLNQAIYEFKNADPTYTKEFISTFQNYKLTDNFRSCHRIVESVNSILNIGSDIKGRSEDKLLDDSVCYLEYEELESLRERYSNYLKQANIPIDKAAVLVRQQTLKWALESFNNGSKHLLIDAIQYWIDNKPSSQLNALDLAGRYLQKHFGGSKTKQNFYCPADVDSVFSWRIFIKDFLDECCKYPELLNITNRLYKDWYAAFNSISSDIFRSSYTSLREYDSKERDFLNLTPYRTPSGTANTLISCAYSNDNKVLPSVHTIHSVKGRDFDSVMVVSSQSNGSGYWKQWIESGGEPKRIGYVANTRPKYSLLWAVPGLKDKDRSKIESFGFKRIDFKDDKEVINRNEELVGK
ncbi:UvrD-helicase domain-containing protein [Paenibacillus sp. NPDC058071]|uniref:UvrD-helicase domain-containing protein n=1 Tax=Paenibacillus sp. NPDC058071 TaxID=3346326 RepID=UPI0036DF4C62